MTNHLLHSVSDFSFLGLSVISIITGSACQKKVVHVIQLMQVIQVEQVVFWQGQLTFSSTSIFLPRSIDFFLLFRNDFMKVDRPSVQFS